MLIITSTNTAKVTVRGTSIELPSVASRLEFYAPPSGKTIEVAQYIYENVQAYNDGKSPIQVDGIKVSSTSYSLAKGTDPETYDMQTIEVAHDKVMADLVAQGFTVEKQL